jgi:autotransporter adhesin
MASAERATAVGHLANASGERSVALGEAAKAQGTNDTVAIGNMANAGMNSTTAVGGQANASGLGSTSIGWQSAATAERAQAFGHLAMATGERSTAVGEAATASGTAALAFGNLSRAEGANSVAIGNGAVASRDNQVVVGNSENTYTLPGIASNASRAAQSGPVNFVTADANGNLAVSEEASNAFASLGSKVQQNADDIADNREGIAMAMALEVPYVPVDRQFAVSGGLGTFDGANAFAMSGAYRINSNTQLDAGVTYGFSRQQVGGRVGVSYSW